MGTEEWGLLLALAALWGSSFFFYKVLVESLPPFTVVFARVALAAIFLNLLLCVQRRPMTLALPWRDFFVMGLLNSAVPFSLLVWGETFISSGLASILNATTPVFTVVVAHFFTSNEKLNIHRALGVALGVLGVAVLMGHTAFADLGSGGLLGEILCLLAALSYGLSSVYGRRFRGMPSIKVATGQLSAATLIILPAAATERFWALPMPSVHIWAALAGISLLCTVAAYILFFQILARAGATNVGLVTLLLPIVALFLGHFVLGEQIYATSLLGMALIGASLAVIDGRPYHWAYSKIFSTQP